MSYLVENVEPSQLPIDTMTVWHGDYYYKDMNEVLWILKATYTPSCPLEITKIAYINILDKLGL